jgi:DNA-binding MarR family transcriptional regulator
MLAATMSSAASTRGLSQLQLEILSLLASRKSGQRVGSVARYFMISAATVSDSLRVLETKRLITKTRDPDDARSKMVTITDAGQVAASGFSVVIEKVRQIVSDWDEDRRAEVLPAVIAVIDGLRDEGTVRDDRMCTSCRYFAINCDLESHSAPYFCRFFDLPLQVRDLRVDCPDFKPQIQS